MIPEKMLEVLKHEGVGEFLYQGKDYDIMKEKFPWMRATLVIKADKITQTL